jgi:hypothetical protein
MFKLIGLTITGKAINLDTDYVSDVFDYKTNALCQQEKIV